MGIGQHEQCGTRCHIGAGADAECLHRATTRGGGEGDQFCPATVGLGERLHAGGKGLVGAPLGLGGDGERDGERRREERTHGHLEMGGHCW